MHFIGTESTRKIDSKNQKTKDNSLNFMGKKNYEANLYIIICIVLSN